MVVRPHLELRIEIQVEEDEPSECSSAVAARKALERVINLLGIAGADFAVVHDPAEAVASLCAKGRYGRLTNSQEVRTQTSNQPLQEDLEDGSRDERVEQANDRVVDVPETSNADLHDQEEEDRNQCCKERCSPYWHDLFAERVRELWIHDVAIWEVDREAARWSRWCFVHAQPDDTHDDHGEDVRPSDLCPLTEGGTCVECALVVAIVPVV